MRRHTDKNITIVMDRDDVTDLTTYAHNSGLSLSNLVRVALNHYLTAVHAEVSLVEIRPGVGRPKRKV